LPFRHERGGRNDSAAAPLAGWIIGQVSGHKKIRRSRQGNREERLIIRVGQIQIGFSAGIKGQPVRVNFVLHFADALRIKLEARAGEDFGIFSKDALVMTNLDGSR